MVFSLAVPSALICICDFTQNRSHFNAVLSFPRNKIHVRELISPRRLFNRILSLLPALHNVPGGPFLPICQLSHDPVAAQHRWSRWRWAGPGRAKSQSQPFSLIMWANSMMNFPSLYFWLDSNACSWNSDSACSEQFVTLPLTVHQCENH